MSPLWPVAWVDPVGMPAGFYVTVAISLGGVVGAAVASRRRWARTLCSVGLLLLGGLINSLGKINHGLHPWIFSAACWCFFRSVTGRSVRPSPDLGSVSYFLEEVFEVGSSGRGVIQAFLALGSSAASLMSARMARRFGPARLLTWSFLLVIVGFIVIAVSPNIVLASVGLLVVGSGMGIACPLLTDFVTSAAPFAYRGSAVGTWLASLRLGHAIGPILGSSLAVGIGGRPVYWLTAGSFTFFALSWLRLRAATKGWLGPPPDEVPDPLIR